MLRSKGLAPLEDSTVETPTGPIQFKGRDDTYNLRAPNRFVWDSLIPGAPRAAMRDYWRGLLALRMSPYGEVFRVAEVPERYYRWITPARGTLLGYVVGERVLVLANSGTTEGVFRFELPEGGWRQVGGLERVDLHGVEGTDARLGGGRHTVRVPAGALFIWVRAREGA